MTDRQTAEEWLNEPLREGRAPAPSPETELRNYGGESVTECAQRLILAHQQDKRDGITARAAARMTAEGCAASWRIVGTDQMADFYSRVAALLSEG